MEEKIIFNYQYNSRKEGISTLIYFNLTIIILFSAYHYIFRNIAKEIGSINFDYFIYGFLILFFMITLAYGIMNIRINRDFSFTITEKMIICETPLNTFGKSYTIHINEIEKIIKDTLTDDIEWYIQTQDSQRHKISQSYKNPARTIVDTILDLNPSIKMEKR